MQQQINQYIEVGELLQDGISLDKLSVLQEKLDEQHFYIPIIGQFSSGKSSLINNLIGRHILPTMLSETTAYTTFLYYGETEYAEIVTNDTRIQFEVEKLMDLSQQNLQTETSVSEILGIQQIHNSEIININVYVQHPLLKTGIVFIDTPGLNTIISNHANRTIDILPKAHAIMYIMGKSLTAADVRLVSMIDQMGIDLLFIRTKIDQLRRDENDTPKKIMQQDQQQLEEAIGRQATYFGVTNEKDLLIIPNWKTLLDEFVNFLQVQFVQNVEDKRKQSIIRQMQQIKVKFVQNLTERKQQLEVSRSVTDLDIQTKIEELQEDIRYVDERVQKQKSNFDLTFEATKQAVLSTYDGQFKAAVDSFGQSLQQYNTVESLQKAAEVQVEQQITKATEALKIITNDKLSEFLQKSTTDTNTALKTDIEAYSLGDIPNIQLQVEVPTVDDIFVQGEFIQEKLQDNTSGYEQRSQEIEQKRAQMEAQGVAIADEMQEATGEMDELGAYEPQYVEKHNTSSQETLKTIGNLADWAMVFIPGKAFATGATKAAGMINKVAIGTKYVEKMAKIASTVEKTGKVLAKTDKYKDITKLIETAQGSQKESGKESNLNVLNLITLEYWFGQVGKVVDGPPQIVEDPQYKEAFLREKAKVEEKIKRAKQSELRRMQQVDSLETREEKLREEKSLQEKYEQQLKRQMYETEKRREQQLREQQVIAYRQQLVRNFEQQMQTLLTSYRSNVEMYLERFITHMPAVISLKLQQQLHIQKQQLVQLIETRQKNKDEQSAYEGHLFNYIQILNS
ncbi:dynamin family protein [Planococcus sp. ISL-109]|uniref:dynamin family protein n=1 Tax=Planococcus sp. ISL-109 TaxID=2819166 RepID=UPI001BEAD7D2|nr:dynamin family protein [Planococcus sp. ISL-109]MBT2581214.1 dynamin family protein [Planococcus sp. ISL-109]